MIFEIDSSELAEDAKQVNPTIGYRLSQQAPWEIAVHPSQVGSLSFCQVVHISRKANKVADRSDFQILYE